MNVDDIRTMPTSITREMWEKTLSGGIHESCTRAYHILLKVKWLLDRDADPEIVREWIDLMESEPPEKER